MWALRDWLLDRRDSVLEHTSCKLGWHSHERRSVRKYDGGNCPLLCRYCYEITGCWRPPC